MVERERDRDSGEVNCVIVVMYTNELVMKDGSLMNIICAERILLQFRAVRWHNRMIRYYSSYKCAYSFLAQDATQSQCFRLQLGHPESGFALKTTICWM